MAPPFDPLAPCCDPLVEDGCGANPNGEACPEIAFGQKQYCMTLNTYIGGLRCRCADATTAKALRKLGWEMKNNQVARLVARLDGAQNLPWRELTALVPPRPIPYPATPAQQIELEVASGKYSQRHVSRFAPPRPENPWPNEFGFMPIHPSPCDNEDFIICENFAESVLRGIPPCGGESSCGDCSPPVWRCGPERTSEQIQAAVDSCMALIQPEERDRCFTALGDYLDCVNRYDSLAHAYQACLVQRIECLAKEAQALKDCQIMRGVVYRMAFGKCYLARGCRGSWFDWHRDPDDTIKEY